MEQEDFDLDTQLCCQPHDRRERQQVLTITISSGLGSASHEFLLIHDRQLISVKEVATAHCFYYRNGEIKIEECGPTNDIQRGQTRVDIALEGFIPGLKVIPKYVNDICRSFELHNYLYHPFKDLLGQQYIMISKQENNISSMKLQEGDTIKIGRQLLNVAFKIQGKMRQIWEQRVFKQREVKEGTCRICLSQEKGSRSDILLTPCRCIGSCEYIHLECLRKWLEKRVIAAERHHVKLYDFSKMNCEICKSDFPRVVNTHRRTIELLPIQYGQGDLLMLENVDTQGTVQKVYCINLNNQQEFIIGRREICDLVFSDSSISRQHAKLRIKDRSVQIQDLQSKFGTFVKLRQRHKDLKGMSMMKGSWTFDFRITNK